MSSALTEEEFVRLFSKHQRSLFMYLLPLVGSAADADEVLQEANVIMWTKRDQFEPGTNFLAWGRAIARLEVFRFRRRYSTRLKFLDADLMEQIAERAEVLTSETELRAEALQHCLGKLRSKDRTLIGQRYRPGMTGDKLARQIGRPANSVYQSLGRIRRTLAECIQRQLAAGGES